MDANFVEIAFGTFLIGLVAESWYSWRFLSRLKRDYPDLWEHSGFRTIWTDSNLISAYGTIRYLKRRVYKERNVAEEIEFCESMRGRVIASYWIGWAGVATVFIGIPAAAVVKGLHLTW